MSQLEQARCLYIAWKDFEASDRLVSGLSNQESSAETERQYVPVTLYFDRANYVFFEDKLAKCMVDGEVYVISDNQATMKVSLINGARIGIYCVELTEEPVFKKSWSKKG